MDSGNRAVDSGLLSLVWQYLYSVSLQTTVLRTVGVGHWAVDSGQWTVDSGQWAVDSGQWTVDSGNRTVGSGQWPFKSGLAIFIFGFATKYSLHFTSNIRLKRKFASGLNSFRI